MRMPDTSTLNEGQKLAYDHLVSYVSFNRARAGSLANRGWQKTETTETDVDILFGDAQPSVDPRPPATIPPAEMPLSILLQGYAGTGKTYLVNSFVEYIVSVMGMKVAITAPTNKAVKVLKDSADYEDASLQYCTIHKLLGLVEKVHADGRITFEPAFGEVPVIEEFNVLIIDETSMLPDELFEMIYNSVTGGSLKLVFIGDSAQIPPVGKDSCIPFNPQKRKEYNIGMIELTQIVRQAADSPIITYATLIRNSRRTEFEMKLDIANGSGIIPVEKGDKDLIYKICDVYFNNDIFKQNSDFMKAIAWRNKTVDAINNKVRSLIYGTTQLPKIMVGEKMIADEPISHPVTGKGIYTTNDEFEVLGYTIAESEVYSKKMKDEVISLYAEYYIVDTLCKRTNEQKEIQVIHERSDETMNALLKGLRDKAIAMKDPQIKKWMWSNYYSVARRFAKTKYNYAITAHKSQGSTYDNLLLLEWDILENPKASESNRILYVGVTRPKKLLFVVR